MKLPYDTRSIGGDPVAALPVTLRGTADAGGNCTLTSRPVPQGRRWRINYLTVTASGTNVPSCDLFVNEALLANVLDGTEDTSAVAAYNPPRILSQGESLVAVWAGADAGASCSLRIEYDVQDN